MLQKCHSDFELQGVADGDLNSKMYQAIVNRLQVTRALVHFCEEAAKSLRVKYSQACVGKTCIVFSAFL